MGSLVSEAPRAVACLYRSPRRKPPEVPHSAKQELTDMIGTLRLDVHQKVSQLRTELHMCQAAHAVRSDI